VAYRYRGEQSKKLKMQRTILFLLIIFSTGTLSGQTKEVQLPNGLLAVNLFSTQSGDSISCYRIPAIVTAPNGDIIAAIDERVLSCQDLHKNMDINIVQRRSTDNGRTWTSIERVIEFPLGESASDPSMIVDQVTGNIFLFYNYMDLENEKGVYNLHVMKSKDNGKTWDGPVDITSQITKLEWCKDFKFITSGRGIQTRSGRLLHTIVNNQKGLHLFGSDDHGKSWFLIDEPINPANESKVVELENGDYMINARFRSEDNSRYIHVSQDQGHSWHSQPDLQLIDPGNNAGFIKYTSTQEGDDKNRLLFSNTKSSEKRENLTVRISYDEGKTWSEGKTIYEGSSAYSELTILENGDIGLFFEADGYRSAYFTSFTLEWLTNGEDKFKK
jgi:sialidase-1